MPLGGKDLFLHVTDACLELTENVVINTDCHEIARRALKSRPSVTVHRRKSTLGDDEVTLDEVIYDQALNINEQFKFIITLQATSPFISVKHLTDAINIFRNDVTKTLVTVVENRHLFYYNIKRKLVPFYGERKNSQWLEPTFTETGGIVICSKHQLLKTGSRFSDEIQPFVVDRVAALDIDCNTDVALAKHFIEGTKLFIVFLAGRNTGSGHYYRCLSLVDEFPEYDCHLHMVGGNTNFLKALRSRSYKLTTSKKLNGIFRYISGVKPDHVVLDVLDTELPVIEKIKRIIPGKVITLEDLGTGTLMSDLTINELYSKLPERPNVISGSEYAFLRPEFAKFYDQKRTIDFLLTFGGTDPGQFSVKFLEILCKMHKKKKIVVLLGLDADRLHRKCKIIQKRFNTNYVSFVKNSKQVQSLMSKTKIAICANGRTVYELLSQGVKVIVKPQNAKEVMHTHSLGIDTVYNYGISSKIDRKNLSKAIQYLSGFVNPAKPKININNSRNQFLLAIKNCLSIGRRDF